MAVAALPRAAWAEPDAYDQARLRHHAVAVSSLATIAQQPSRFLTQAVELRGRVTGLLRSDRVCTVLFRLESGEAVQILVGADRAPTAVGQCACVLARLAEPPGEAYTFTLLALKQIEQAPPASPPPAEQGAAQVAAAQLAQVDPSSLVAPQPRYVLPSRGGPPPPSEERILAAYAQAIGWFNPRLAERERQTIARHIIDFSRRVGVDARLVMAVVAAESNFNASATSRAGAMGLGQLMPATARGMGVSNPYDTKQNLWAAIRIIRGHLEKMDGDLALALACYNAGSGAVRKYGGVPPYRETQNYIRKVISIYLQLAPEMAP